MSKTTPTYKNQQLVQGRQPHWGWQHEWSGRHVIQTILANHMLLSICLGILTYGLEALLASRGNESPFAAPSHDILTGFSKQNNN